MSEFDPTQPSMVHDLVNDKTLEWKPEWVYDYRQHAINLEAGVIAWDGLLLDGWKPLVMSA